MFSRSQLGAKRGENASDRGYSIFKGPEIRKAFKELAGGGST